VRKHYTSKTCRPSARSRAKGGGVVCPPPGRLRHRPAANDLTKTTPAPCCSIRKARSRAPTAHGNAAHVHHRSTGPCLQRRRIRFRRPTSPNIARPSSMCGSASMNAGRQAGQRPSTRPYGCSLKVPAPSAEQDVPCRTTAASDDHRSSPWASSRAPHGGPRDRLIWPPRVPAFAAPVRRRSRCQRIADAANRFLGRSDDDSVARR